MREIRSFLRVGALISAMRNDATNEAGARDTMGRILVPKRLRTVRWLTVTPLVHCSYASALSPVLLKVWSEDPCHSPNYCNESVIGGLFQKGNQLPHKARYFECSWHLFLRQEPLNKESSVKNYTRANSLSLRMVTNSSQRDDLAQHCSNPRRQAFFPHDPEV